MKQRLERHALKLSCIVLVPLILLFGYWFANASQRSMCSFDQCEPLTWAETWALPITGCVVIVFLASCYDLSNQALINKKPVRNVKQ